MFKKEYFETFKLEDIIVDQLSNNKTYKVHGVGTVIFKIFYDYEFLLYNVGHILKLKRVLFSISMFDYLDYFTRVEHRVLNIFHGRVIMTKGFM